MMELTFTQDPHMNMMMAMAIGQLLIIVLLLFFIKRKRKEAEEEKRAAEKAMEADPRLRELDSEWRKYYLPERLIMSEGLELTMGSGMVVLVLIYVAFQDVPVFFLYPLYILGIFAMAVKTGKHKVEWILDSIKNNPEKYEGMLDAWKERMSNRKYGIFPNWKVRTWNDIDPSGNGFIKDGLNRLGWAKQKRLIFYAYLAYLLLAPGMFDLTPEKTLPYPFLVLAGVYPAYAFHNAMVWYWWRRLMQENVFRGDEMKRREFDKRQRTMTIV